MDEASLTSTLLGRKEEVMRREKRKGNGPRGEEGKVKKGKEMREEVTRRREERKRQDNG